MPAGQCTAVDDDGYAVTGLGRGATTTSLVCSPATVAPGRLTACTATVSGAPGAPTPSGGVLFTSTGAGHFSSILCRLAGSGAVARCASSFSSMTRGGQAVVARYLGDGSSSGSSGAALVRVALPASTNGCVAALGVRLSLPDGDQASASGVALATSPRGVESFLEGGPAHRLSFRSTQVEALVCRPRTRHAVVFGTGLVTGAGAVRYRIDLRAGTALRRPTFRLRLSTGYDTGVASVRSGGVVVSAARAR